MQQKEIDLAKKVLDEEEAPKKFHYNYEVDENVDPFDFEEDDDKKTKGKKLETIIPSTVMANMLDIFKEYPCYTGCKKDLTKTFIVGQNKDKWLYVSKYGNKEPNDQYIKNHLLPALVVILLYEDKTYVSIQGKGNKTYYLPGIGNKNPITQTNGMQIKNESSALSLPRENTSVKIKFGLLCPVNCFLQSLSREPPKSYSYIVDNLVISNYQQQEAFIMTINSPATAIFKMLELCSQIDHYYSSLSSAFDFIKSYDNKLKKADEEVKELNNKLKKAKVFDKNGINQQLNEINAKITQYNQKKEQYQQAQMKASAALKNALKVLEKNKAIIQKESEQTVEKIAKEYTK